MNYEALDAFGINISAASLENSEFVKGLGKSWNQLSDNEKMMAVYNEIVRQSGSAQGLAKQEAQSFGMQMKLLAQKIKETAGAIGETLLPYLEPFVQKISEVVEKIGQFASENPKLTAAILGTVGAIGALLLVLGPLLMLGGTILGGIALAGSAAAVLGVSVSMLSGVFLGVIAAIVAVIAAGMLIITHWDQIKATAQSLWQSIQARWEQIKASTAEAWNNVMTTVSNIWNSIKTACTNTFNSIKTTVVNIWNNIKSTTSSVWNSIKSSVSSIWNSIKSLASSVFNAIKNVITTIWNAVKSTTTSVWNSIKSTTTSIWNSIKSTITSILNAIKSAVSSGMNAVKSTMVNIMNSAKSALSGMVGAFTSVGRNIIQGVANGIRSGVSSVINAAVNAAKSALNAAKNALGIHSPSRVMEREVGRFIPDGLALGITANLSSVKNAVNEMAGMTLQPAIASLDNLDYAGTMNYQLDSQNDNTVNNDAHQPQPAYINFRFGARKFKGFVKDITRAQDTEVELIEEYGI